MMKDLVCQTCNLFTNMTDQNEAQKFHRKVAPSHAPDLITSGQWVRKLEKAKKRR
jgi:hypothetical protein